MLLRFGLLCLALLIALGDAIVVGVGKSDITGRVAGVNFMGYAADGQEGTGVINRLQARTFVIFPGSVPARETTIVIINLDLQSVPVRLRQHIVTTIEERHGVRASNIFIHAQHTHSGPGQYLPSSIYQYPVFDFDEEQFAFVVRQVLESFTEAFSGSSRFDARLFVSETSLTGTGRNRSPPGFTNNPADEIDEYRTEMGEDKNTKMTVVRITDTAGNLRGVFNFFAIHTVSVDIANTLVASDNKGFAQYVIEERHPGVVAAFLNADAADVSPNMLDESDTVFTGEGTDSIESAEIVGMRQAEALQSVLDGDRSGEFEVLDGDFASSFHYHNFSTGLCRPELGISFLAGTEDGRGLFLIGEGWTDQAVEDNGWLGLVGSIARPVADSILENPSSLDDDSAWSFAQVQNRILTEEEKESKYRFLQEACSAPKYALIQNDDETTLLPEVLPVQVLKLGDLYIVGLSFEVSSMSGHRIRKLVKSRVGEDKTVVVAGYSNGYSSYLTTPEEYDTQQYEGAFTIFGRGQLDSVLAEVSIALDGLAEGGQATTEKELFADGLGLDVDSLTAKVLASEDTVIGSPEGAWFETAPGEIITDSGTGPFDVSSFGYGDRISATFGCASIEDSQRVIPSFCTLEYDSGNGFESFLGDDDWSLRFSYIRDWGDRCTCEWVPFTTLKTKDIPAGTYRLRYSGIMDTTEAIAAISSEFTVSSSRMLGEEGVDSMNNGRVLRGADVLA